METEPEPEPNSESTSEPSAPSPAPSPQEALGSAPSASPPQAETLRPGASYQPTNREERILRWLGEDEEARFRYRFSDDAKEAIWNIMNSRQNEGLKRQLLKALRRLRISPFLTGLNSHPHTGWKRGSGVTYFTSYVQNNTPNAYRIIWTYDLEYQHTIWVDAIVGHSDRSY